jgi:hypothetical protein
MGKRIGLFLIAFTMLFCGAFYSVNFQEGEDPSVLSGNLPESGEFSDGTGNAVMQAGGEAEETNRILVHSNGSQRIRSRVLGQEGITSTAIDGVGFHLQVAVVTD